jgi:hypothetical protein
MRDFWRRSLFQSYSIENMSCFQFFDFWSVEIQILSKSWNCCLGWYSSDLAFKGDRPTWNHGALNFWFSDPPWRKTWLSDQEYWWRRLLLSLLLRRPHAFWTSESVLLLIRGLSNAEGKFGCRGFQWDRIVWRELFGANMRTIKHEKDDYRLLNFDARHRD